jgi:hypothetical protein
MSGKRGFMMKRHDKLISRCGNVRREPRTKRLQKKRQKAADESWYYSGLLAGLFEF